jgi:hypothetical protein
MRKDILMKSITIKCLTPANFFLPPVLMFLLILPFGVWGQGRTSDAADAVSGRYAGTVVVSTPVSLGVLDLAFEVGDVNGVLSGTVDATHTQVFLAEPMLQGSITSSPGAITPTFRLASEAFDVVISGRTVSRHFSLAGEVLKNGDVLQGQYEEVIEGFTPEPVMVTGTFLLVRPFGSTGTSAPPEDQFIYLPLVLK